MDILLDALLPPNTDDELAFLDNMSKAQQREKWRQTEKKKLSPKQVDQCNDICIMMIICIGRSVSGC